MTPIQFIGLGATGLFAYKAIDALERGQAADNAASGVGVNIPGAQQIVVSQKNEATSLYKNAVLFGVLGAAALGATVLLWDRE